MVCLLQLLLTHVDVLGSLLLLLQLPDVVDGRFQDGAFVPAHLADVIVISVYMYCSGREER